MAEKKVFTGYDFQGGGQSKNLRLESRTDDPTHVGKGHAYYNTTAGTIKASNADAGSTAAWKTLLTTDSSIAASQVDLTNVDAVTLDGKDSSANAVADKIPIYGTNGVLPVGTPAANGDAATKLYVDTEISDLVASAPAHLDTLKELADAMGSADGAATITAQLANRLRIDVNDQGLSATQLTNARTNLGLGALATLSAVGASEITNGEVGTNELADDAITPAKIADTYSFTMNGLTSTGQVMLQYDDPVLQIGKVNVTTGNSKLQFNSKNGSAANAFSLQYIKDSTNDRLAFLGGGATEDFTVINGGKAGIGADATAPSGTLHVSTARYGAELITNGTMEADSDWTTMGTITTNEQSSTQKYAGTYSRKLVGTVNNPGSGIRSATFSVVAKRKYYVEVWAYVTVGSILIRLYDGNGSVVGSSSAQSANSAWTKVVLTTEAAVTGSGAYFKIYQNGNTAATAYFDAASVREDNLANGVADNGNDLIVNNNTATGISIVGQAESTSSLYFGDGLDGDHSRIYSSRTLSNGNSTIKFAASANSSIDDILTLDGANQTAKFEGGVGVNYAPSATCAFSAKSTGDGHNIVDLVHSGGSNGLFNVHQSGTGVKIRAYDDGNAKIELLSNGTSYFNGDNVAIGTTSSTSKLTVNNSSGVSDIRIYSGGNDAIVSFGDDTNNYAIGADETTNKFSIARQGDLNGSIKLSVDSDGSLDQEGNSIVNSSTVQGLQDGACYDFDGSASSIDLGDSNAITTGENITVGAWVKNEGTTSGRIFQAQKGAGSTVYSLVVNNNTGSDAAGYIASLTWDGSDHDWVSHDASIDDSKWHHLAMVLTASSQKLYVDGVEVKSATNTFSNDSSADHAFIGAVNGASQFFQGQIRDVKIFPSALDAGDIRKLYSGENPKNNLNVDVITNGDFSSSLSTGWSVASGTIAISGGECVFSDENGILNQNVASSVTVGKTYLLSFDYDVKTANSIRTVLTGHSLLEVASSGSGRHSSVWVANSSCNVYIYGYADSGETCSIDNVTLTEVGTLVDFNPQSASSSKWYNEAIPALFHGTVTNATLSQGNSYWNNIKQDGADVEVPTTLIVGTEKQTTTKDLTIATAGSPAIGLYSTHANVGTRNWAIRSNHTDYGDLCITTSDARLGDPTQGGASSTRLTLTENGNAKVHGKLGVGRIASDESLEVQGNIKLVGGTNHRLKIANDSNNNWGEIGNDGASGENSLEFFTGSSSTAAMSLTNGNRCGLGTITPFNELHIKESNASILINSDVDTSGSTAALYFKADSQNNDNRKKGAIYFERTDIRGVGKFVFATQSSSEADTSVALSDSRLEIDHLGTQDHKANRIVNSQTVSDLHRTAEPSLKFGEGANFAGGNCNVSYGDVLAIEGDLTVAAWVRPEGVYSDYNTVIARRGTGGTNYELFFKANTGELSWYNGNQYNSTYVPTSNKWVHIAGTVNGTTLKLYADGVLVKEDTISAAPSGVGTQALWVGTFGGEFFIGEIKDVRIHNRALEADEVKALYNGESTPWKYANTSTASIITGNNSTFNGNLGDWTTNNTWSTQTNDAAKMQLAANAADQRCYLDNVIEHNKKYRFEYDADVDSISGTVELRGWDGSAYVSFGSLVEGTDKTLEFDTSGIAVTSTTLYIGAVASGAAVTLNNLTLVQLGEVASYTPQSINDKWYDTTSNANHGEITGATTVGDTDHFGVLTVKGRSVAGDDDRNTAGCVLLGDGANNEQGRFDFDPIDTTSLAIDNTTNNSSAKIEFGLRASGTRVVPLQLVGDGSVKARSAASDNLKQVARVHSEDFTLGASDTSKVITHNLGTGKVVISVRVNPDTTPTDGYAHVEVFTKIGDTGNSNTNDKVSLYWATAPTEKKYTVTVIG